MGALTRAGQLALGAALVGAVAPACYSAGTGTSPPTDSFYFPVGLAVSPEGKALFVANSDFDLQWNGGTLQSYKLDHLRDAAASLITANLTGAALDPQSLSYADFQNFTARTGIAVPIADCPGRPLPGQPLGQQCAPPFPSTIFFGQAAIIGAFATNALLSTPTPGPGDPLRLYVPVRGEAAVTWAKVGADAYPGNPDPLSINCGQGADRRCTFSAGNDPNQLGDTRGAVMPGEPFGIAQTEDGTALAVTSQTDTKVSLLATGFPAPNGTGPINDVTMQYVLDGLPTGGVGIAAVPHDKEAPVKPCEDKDPQDAPPCVRAAFLETNRSNAELDLLRYYDDDGSSMQRPFLTREAVYPITSNAIGTDSRGIVIDPTPRYECKDQGNDHALCAQLPARLFFASRTPPVLGRGLVGGVPTSGVGAYDPDLVTYLPPVTVPAGPSNVYLAPILDANGAMQLRVFEVLFDSNQIAVYDPERGAIEKIIDVGIGPFGMAFDPFTFAEVAQHQVVTHGGDPTNPQNPQNGTYRFAYVTSFTYSYVQMIDLDDSQPTPETFEQVVFTLGTPTAPKGQ